jgi:hypothetical protein
MRGGVAEFVMTQGNQQPLTDDSVDTSAFWAWTDRGQHGRLTLENDPVLPLVCVVNFWPPLSAAMQCGRKEQSGTEPLALSLLLCAPDCQSKSLADTKIRLTQQLFCVRSSLAPEPDI